MIPRGGTPTKRLKPKARKKRYRGPFEDEPGWNARKHGNRTGWHRGRFYRNGKPLTGYYNGRHWKRGRPVFTFPDRNIRV